MQSSALPDSPQSAMHVRGILKISLGAVVLAAVLAVALWNTGVVGGETVLGTRFLDGRTPGASVAGATVVMVIGAGGVPEGLEPGAEIVIGALDSGVAYCRAVIVSEINTPDGPGYTAECTAGV